MTSSIVAMHLVDKVACHSRSTTRWRAVQALGGKRNFLPMNLGASPKA